MPRKDPLHVYSTDPDWSDIDPIPQDDGGPDGLAVIAYADEYREVSSYLRAVMAGNERSERVLKLTSHLIELNPAHYTVWLYRAKVLESLGSDVLAELAWLNGISLKHIKNYQIWHHREILLERIAAGANCIESHSPRLSKSGEAGFSKAQLKDILEGEFDFLAEMFAQDYKNYHVWSYRQWLVKRFSLWDAGELEEAERLLRKDVRNNSAWNHRWFVVFGKYGKAVKSKKGKSTDEQQSTEEIPEAVWIREYEFVKSAIRLTPQNESPWNYLRGLIQQNQESLASNPNGVLDFAREFVSNLNPSSEQAPRNQDSEAQETEASIEGADDDSEDDEYEDEEENQEVAIRSPHALELLAEAWGEQGTLFSRQSRHQQAERHQAAACQAYKLLAEVYDPIRVNYWSFKKATLPSANEMQDPDLPADLTKGIATTSVEAS